MNLHTVRTHRVLKTEVSLESGNNIGGLCVSACVRVCVRVHEHTHGQFRNPKQSNLDVWGCGEKPKAR